MKFSNYALNACHDAPGDEVPSFEEMLVAVTLDFRELDKYLDRADLTKEEIIEVCDRYKIAKEATAYYAERIEAQYVTGERTLTV